MWEDGKILWGPGTSEPGQCLGLEGEKKDSNFSLIQPGVNWGGTLIP